MDVLLGVELEGVLYSFDGGPGAGMLGGAVFVNGYVVFSPIDEILPKARVF